MNAEQRREQLIACASAVAAIAEHRTIVPKLAVAVKDDVEVRPVLKTVIRRWTRLVKPDFVSVGAAAAGEKLHVEHIVPCRVLVDRMIMNTSECRDLLRKGVVLALVTKDEHHKLGGIFTHHPELYAQMLTAPVADLPALGRERYSRSGVLVDPIVSTAGML